MAKIEKFGISYKIDGGFKTEKFEETLQYFIDLAEREIEKIFVKSVCVFTMSGQPLLYLKKTPNGLQVERNC